MAEFTPFDPKWFKDLKETRKEFSEVNNLIESAKFKYEREFNNPKWVIGIGISIFLASGYSIKGLNPVIIPYATVGFFVSALMLIVGLILLNKLSKVQQIAMAYLYREKDKQDKILISKK